MLCGKSRRSEFNMKKLSIIFVFLILLVSSVSAEPLRWGLLGGLNCMNISNDTSGVSTEKGLGFTFGGQVRMPIDAT